MSMIWSKCAVQVTTKFLSQVHHCGGKVVWFRGKVPLELLCQVVSELQSPSHQSNIHPLTTLLQAGEKGLARGKTR